MEHHKHPGRFLRHIVSVPFIWMMIAPVAFLDIFLEIYHHTCFPLYGLPLVKRKEYVKLDRYKLPYLSFLDKINCAYCEYANGVINYAARIAGDTERYWCGIKHDKTDGFVEPTHQREFMRYGDAKAYKQCKMQK